MTVDEMQIGFMPERGTIDAEFILSRMQEKYMLRKVIYVFCGPSESF